jgi:hypothetical protein
MQTHLFRFLCVPENKSVTFLVGASCHLFFSSTEPLGAAPSEIVCSLPARRPLKTGLESNFYLY